MNYFKEFKNIEKEKMEKIQQRRDLISDYTYLVFEKEFFNKMPSMIEELLAEYKENCIYDSKNIGVKLLFLVSNIEYDDVTNINIGDVKIVGNEYSLVNIDELVSYLEHFGRVTRGGAANANIILYVDLFSLINYYYEELQREEYIGNGRK